MKETDLETALNVFDIGLSFALCHKDFGPTRQAVKELQSDFKAIRALIPVQHNWIKLTNETVGKQEPWLYGELWVEWNGEVHAGGRYEWRQGSNPDRIYVGGIDLHAIGCFVMPMSKPLPPAPTEASRGEDMHG
jgi:hypothetical protein